MIYIGFDNGVSGSIGIINGEEVKFFPTPVFSGLNYQKKAKNITRVDRTAVKVILANCSPQETRILIERPLVNPTRFEATASALRAYEATLTVFEDLGLGHETVDSKAWQKHILPAGLKGIELKHASLQIAKRIYPFVDLGKMKDADGLLIARYCQMYYS